MCLGSCHQYVFKSYLPNLDIEKRCKLYIECKKFNNLTLPNFFRNVILLASTIVLYWGFTLYICQYSPLYVSILNLSRYKKEVKVDEASPYKDKFNMFKRGVLVSYFPALNSNFNIR